MPNALPPRTDLDDDDLGALAQRALARSGPPDALLVGMRRFDGGSDRNAVRRATVRTPGGDVPVIVKAARAFDPAAGAARESGAGRELTALRLLDERARASAGAARLVAADPTAGVTLTVDLGEGTVTLVGAFTGDDPALAERALTDLAAALGALHAVTADCAVDHARLAVEAFPGADPTVPPSLPAFERAAAVLVERLGGSAPSTELAALAERWDAPGPWSALVHGDPCPDNALRAAEGRVQIIDFEFARPGHALHDAACWHLGFPSCWCAGTLPDATLARADAAYRGAVSASMPICADDDAWADELARACALQLLSSAPRVLDAALGEDRPWGTARHRERLLHWLRTCARMLDERELLPGLRRSIAAWTDAVERLGGASDGLARYRAFAPAREGAAVRLAMAVVVRDGLVLVQRRWRRDAGFVHEFPGGRAEPGESAARAAARELLEETGLAESDVAHVSVARSRDGGTVSFVVFRSRSDAAPRRTARARRQTFHWWAPADIPLDTFPPADADFVRRTLPALLGSDPRPTL